jgi:flagellar M-ring protein FliF
VQAAPGSVQRLTVAVVLNSKSTGAVNQAQLQQLIGNAVGLDAKRGDSVQVTSLPFDTSAAQTAAKELAQVQADAKLAGYLDIGKKAGIGLVALIIFFLAMRRRKKEQAAIEATASDLPEPVIIPSQHAITAGPLAIPHQPTEVAKDRERLRDEVAELVENQPDEVAQVIQGWLQQRSG